MKKTETTKSKHAGGRPHKYTDEEVMQKKIDTYFASVPEEEWTVTGLAMALDMDRHTLQNYRDNDKFSTSVKKAYMMVQNSYEKSLRKYGRSGDIFALKNFGWQDVQQIDANVDNTVHIEVDVEDEIQH